jgi:hypothetical protein
VPWLDGHPYPGGKQSKHGIEGVGVGAQSRGQLKQHGTQLGAERVSPIHEPGHRLGRVAQPLDVGEVAAHLHGHHEVVRCAGAPVSEGLPLGQPVERVVDLDGGEPVGEVLQPQAHRHVPWVEPVPPRVVLPAGRADVDHVNNRARMG